MALSARFAKGGRTSGGEEVCETAMPVPLYYVDAAFDGMYWGMVMVSFQVTGSIDVPICWPCKHVYAASLHTENGVVKNQSAN